LNGVVGGHFRRNLGRATWGGVLVSRPLVAATGSPRTPTPTDRISFAGTRTFGRSKRKDLTGQTLEIYWRHARVYWPMLLMCAAGIIAIIGSDTVSPLFYKRFFDQLAIDPVHKTTRAVLTEIYHTIALIAFVMLCSWIGWRSCSWAVMRFESRTMKDLTDYCFDY